MKALVSVSEKLGLSLSEAAEYVGVGINLFDQMVKDGRMPPARKINARMVWSRRDVEKWFDQLPYAGAVVQSGESVADDWGVKR